MILPEKENKMNKKMQADYVGILERDCDVKKPRINKNANSTSS